MASESEILGLSVKIIYGFPALTKQQKLFWAEAIRAFLPNISESEIQLIESVGASKPIQKPGDLTKTCSSLSLDEKIHLVGLLRMFEIKASEFREENTNMISKAVAHAGEVLLDQQDRPRVDDKLMELNNQLHVYRNRPFIKIPARIWPLTFDFAIRCVLLILMNQSILSAEAFTAVNFSFISIAVILIAYWAGNRDRKFNTKILDEHGGSMRFKIGYKLNTSQYSIVILMACLGIYSSFVLTPDFFIASLFLLPVYYFIYIRFFCLGRLTANSIQNQIAEAKQEHVVLDADKNDEAIVMLETRLNSITSRLEAYVLESALFGALSFSGFLQIISDNQVTFSILEKFAQQVYHVTEGFLKGNQQLLLSSFSNLNTKENLFCLVSVESLLCSILFLGVIASRLRFSNVADRVQFSLNLSKAYNQKEELLIEKQVALNTARFVEINAKVNQYLHEGESIMNEVSPVMNLMQYLRNAGLLTFLMILISSAFFITPAIAIGFTLLSFMAWAYFNRNFIQTNIQYTVLNIRVWLIKYSWWIAVFVALLIGLGLLLRIQLKVDKTYGLILWGTLVLAAFLFTWIVFYPQVDKQFGAIEGQANQWNDRRWLLIKIPIAFLTSTNVLAIYMKINHMPGADEMLLIGFTGVAMLTFFLSFYLSKPRWIGVLPSFALSTNLIGTLFKTLHLAGASEMVIIGIIGAAICIPLFFFLRKRFHRLFFFFSIWFMSINVLLLSGAIDRTALRLEHKTWQVERVIQVRDHAFQYYSLLPEINLSKDAEINQILEECSWYLNEFGDLGYSSVLPEHIRIFETVQQSALRLLKLGKQDQLPLGAEVSAQIRAIIIRKSLYCYQHLSVEQVNRMVENETKILQALNRQADAIHALESILTTKPPESVRNRVQELKVELMP